MATVARTLSKQAERKSLVSRTLDRCRSSLSPGRGGGGASTPVAGCFSVYVGPERERFVVRVECANHPMFRRLLDDAEREYGYAAQGPLALPGCDVDAFLDVLWQMERDGVDDDGRGEITPAVSSPICGMRGGSKGRVAGYRMLISQRSAPVVGRRS